MEVMWRETIFKEILKADISDKTPNLEGRKNV
jgi:hypothetical protein